MKHSSYAQWIFKLGFPANDPIVELAATWAAGVKPGARTFGLAVLSAERWRESRDKRLRSAATTILNRLAPLAAAAMKAEEARQFQHKPGSLTSGARYNPRRGRSPKRKKVWRIPVEDSDSINLSVGRDVREHARYMKALKLAKRNPGRRRGSYYVHDRYLGSYLDFPSVKVAARFAKSRFGCEPAADCVYVENDETLVPLGALRRRNPRRRSRRARRARR